VTTLHDFTANTLAGAPKPLADYRDKVVLVVNTACECGFTPQYAGLQALYARHQPEGLEVLGFPCNQFGHQEPGDAAEIAAFCEQNYGVRFQMFAKIDVNGAGAHPLYQWLKRSAPGVLGTGFIKWNFTKFLVGRDGKVVKRFGPRDTPQDIAPEIERLLARS
jgi:glutathione peroxidase